MHIFTTSQKKHIARNIRRELGRKFPDYRRNRLLANLLGVSPATVSRWTDGVVTPGLKQLFLLSVEFGVPLHRLCGCSGKRPVRTKSRIFDIVMNLSIALERAERDPAGSGGEIRVAMERMTEVLDGLLNSK